MGQANMSVEAELRHLFEHIPGLPLPIAVPLRTAHIASTRGEQVEALIDTGEALVTFLGFVALCDASADGQAIGVFQPRLAARPTMGTWRTVFGALAHKAKQPTVPMLKLLRQDDSQWAKLDAAFGQLADVRNRQAHDSAEVFRHGLDDHHRELVLGLVQALSLLNWLSGYVLVRVEGQDDLTGEVRLRPLIGHDLKRSAITVRWPHPPRANQVVFMAVEPSARWLSLNPLYRWVDGHLLAYGRTDGPEDAQQARWLAVDGSGTQATRDEPDPAWLCTFLRPERMARGRAAFTDQTWMRLGQMDVTRLYEASGQYPLPTPAPAQPAPKGSRGALMLGVLVGLVGVASWFGYLQFAPTTLEAAAAPDAAPAAVVTSLPPGRPLTPPSTATESRWQVRANRPPEAVIQTSAEAYNAKAFEGLQRLFLDPIECYHSVTYGRARGRRFFKKDGRPVITGTSRHVIKQVEVVKRQGDEALICERRSFVHRVHPKAKPVEMVVYWGVRIVEDEWRIFAEAGHHPKGKDHPVPFDSKCVDRLAERFGITDLTTLGETRCGRSGVPAKRLILPKLIRPGFKLKLPISAPARN